ncbi:MAG: efflux RND transporter periplasmic adaptor subunit [Chromatiaceae bacterium]|nr:efflux RND transporter periplasmic adaptor subunit [Gammaproteobacteria bacterium]MCP5314604.1 efflux RND transporter periplasmic adaptor subunit [Chromatiaceae bacterium]
MMGTPRWMGWVAAVLGLLAGSAQAAELATVPVARADLPRVYRLDGVAEATQRSTVSAQTAGRVLAVAFDVDDFVRQGDVIVQIDDSQQQASVRQAEANLRAAAVKRQDAAQEHERVRGAFAKDALPKADMDRATAALQQARANEQAAEASLQQARQELAYTHVTAPYNGIVTERLVEVGETVQPGKPLMTGLSLDSMRISVDVPQNLIESIRKERKAQAQINDQWISAEDITVFPVADPRSDTFEVRLQLPAGTEGIFPGMYVKVGFVAGAEPSLVIPLSAVVFRSEMIGVYVVNGDGKIHLRHIRLGSSAGAEHVSVLSGLSEGELVATDPVAAVIQLKSQRAARVDNE